MRLPFCELEWILGWKTKSRRQCITTSPAEMLARRIDSDTNGLSGDSHPVNRGPAATSRVAARQNVSQLESGENPAFLLAFGTNWGLRHLGQEVLSLRSNSLFVVQKTVRQLESVTHSRRFCHRFLS